MSLENHSYQRHVQLRGEIGKMKALAEQRHIEPFYRAEIRSSILKISQCLDDIESIELSALNQKAGNE